jgi:hypothetical protein
VYIARPHQGVDVGLVRLRRHGVAQKYNSIHLSNGQPGTDLEVSAHWAAEQTFNVKPCLLTQTPTRRSCGHQLALTQEHRELLRQTDDVVLLVVMGDECNLHRLHPNDQRVHGGIKNRPNKKKGQPKLPF